MLKRTEESKLTSWYFEIDRRLLFFVIFLVFVGMWAMVSAGSVAAERISQPWYFFILKALPFYGIGLVTLFLSSALDKKWVLRISALNVAICLFLLLVTVFAPMSIKGSTRWVDLGFFSVMPADIMKPGFIMITAWFLATMKEKFGQSIFFNKEAWQLKRLSWVTYIAIALPALFIILKHPDLGTFLLYFTVLSTMFFIAGLPLVLIPIIVGFMGMIGVFAFFTMPHVHSRIISLFSGGSYQIKQSIQSIQHGGLLGSGDDAFIKQSLPDAHTDFIFSAIAEDSGAILACALLCIFLYVLNRLTTSALRARDPFVFYATGGAAALFGGQVSINIMSALHLFPPKGMTLPFISYGGSSFVAFCLLFGMILAIVREDKWK
ncbi:MAG: FtsW/RodA/SpoVE family cell cycle protein [Alphaproteobacteria bacterium]|nr:FtsW/RodA/SpoVE family cell cycle protein [Alphaproteobacteria bacterium]MBN2675524.1 FtsW/RodA/SpoVE family cell cycle protein [Alphaproteobacteria bacterium]